MYQSPALPNKPQRLMGDYGNFRQSDLRASGCGLINKKFKLVLRAGPSSAGGRMGRLLIIGLVI